MRSADECMIAGMKFCPRCETPKPHSEFVVNLHRHDGLSGYCGPCMKAYNREREARLRAAALELLGGRCAHCQIADRRVLAIDHIEGGGSAQRRAGLKQAKFYRYVLDHPDEFQALCHNCNWIKRLAALDTADVPLDAETVTAG